MFVVDKEFAKLVYTPDAARKRGFSEDEIARLWVEGEKADELLTATILDKIESTPGTFTYVLGLEVEKPTGEE